MNPPSRLSQDGADEFEAALLRSARSDGASASRDRTLAALAIAGTAGVAGGLAATKVQGALAAAGKQLPWLKWIAGIGLIVGGGAAGIVAYRHYASPAADVHPAVVQPSEKPPEPAVTATPPGVVPAPAATTAPRPHAAKARSKAPAGDSLLEEVSILDRARQQLLGRDGVAAARTAESYLTRFPDGRLTGEAEFIRVRAALLTGGHAAAAPLAESFLREHPDSPHAPALRKILEAAPRAGGP